MSSDDSKRNPSQARQEKSKEDASAQAQKPQGTGTPRPLPFDETGGSEGASQTTNPQNPPIDRDF